MSETSELQFEIDQRISDDKVLLSAVEAANVSFRRAVESQPDLVPASGVLSWKIGVHPPDGIRILRKYSEPNPDGKTLRSTTTELFPSAMLDPVQRDISMLRLLNAISRWRMAEVNERIREHLRELDSEEQNAVAHAH